MNNFALYVHVPWCRRRCPYCDFYLTIGKPAEQFVDGIMAEWLSRKNGWPQLMASTLYFGGGTPSLLPASELKRLINFFHDQNDLKRDAEITLEVNPEDIDQRYADDLFAAGVNRVSVGVQSFDDQVLRALGRKHSSLDAKQTIDFLKNAGFENISIDFIVGNVGEDVARLVESIHYIYSQKIHHVSTYLLTIEENTNFYKRIKNGKMAGPDDDAQADVYRLVQKSLRSLEYVQYDVSSYARPGFMSRHNQVYWAQGSYCGLGPGAHSMRFLADGGIERIQNQAVISEWVRNPKNESCLIYDQLNPREALLEAMAFGLRNMVTGINAQFLSERHQTSLPLSFFATQQKFKSFGWLEEFDGHMRISQEGALFADAIMREIISS